MAYLKDLLVASKATLLGDTVMGKALSDKGIGSVDGTMSLVAEGGNQINFGGSNNSTTIYFGKTAKDSKAIPTVYQFGSDSALAEIKAGTFMGTTFSGTAANASKLENLSSSAFFKYRGMWTNSTTLNVNNAEDGMSFVYYQNLNSPTTGPLVSFAPVENNNYKLQLLSQFDSPTLYYRTKNGDKVNTDQEEWNNWAKVIDDLNYKSIITTLNDLTLNSLSFKSNNYPGHITASNTYNKKLWEMYSLSSGSSESSYAYEGIRLDIFDKNQNSQNFFFNSDGSFEAKSFSGSALNFIDSDSYRFLNFFKKVGSSNLLTTNLIDTRDASGNGHFRVRIYNWTNGSTKTDYYTDYFLPSVPYNSITQNKEYWILTTKEAVSVAQGGTGASTAEGARTNLNAAAKNHTHSNYYDSTISRTKNTVLAAPNGSNGGATFRALVAADIPALDYLSKSGGSVSGSISPSANNTYTLGTSSYKWSAIYANNIYGTVSYATSAGSATTATTANKTANSLTINVNGSKTSYDGSSAKTITITTGNTTDNDTTYTAGDGLSLSSSNAFSLSITDNDLQAGYYRSYGPTKTESATQLSFGSSIYIPRMQVDKYGRVRGGSLQQYILPSAPTATVSGDYLPLSGGTLTGNLTISHNNTNYTTLTVANTYSSSFSTYTTLRATYFGAMELTAYDSNNSSSQKRALSINTIQYKSNVKNAIGLINGSSTYYLYHSGWPSSDLRSAIRIYTGTSLPSASSYSSGDIYIVYS